MQGYAVMLYIVFELLICNHSPTHPPYIQGEREWRCSSTRTPNRRFRVQDIGHSALRPPGNWQEEGCGCSLHRRRHGHCGVCAENRRNK